LLKRLAKDHFAQVSPELRAAVLSYYSDLNAPFANKKNKKEWAQVVRNLDELKGLKDSSETKSTNQEEEE
jgi:hypothetical protein